MTCLGYCDISASDLDSPPSQSLKAHSHVVVLLNSAPFVPRQCASSSAAALSVAGRRATARSALRRSKVAWASCRPPVPQHMQTSHTLKNSTDCGFPGLGPSVKISSLPHLNHYESGDPASKQTQHSALRSLRGPPAFCAASPSGPSATKASGASTTQRSFSKASWRPGGPADGAVEGAATVTPTLGSKAYKRYLLWAIWSLRDPGISKVRFSMPQPWTQHVLGKDAGRMHSQAREGCL